MQTAPDPVLLQRYQENTEQNWDRDHNYAEVATGMFMDSESLLGFLRF